MFSRMLTKKTSYLLKDLSDGRTIWIDTLDFSASNAWVKTGVVIGIFSVVEFLPNMYLYIDELISIYQSESQNTTEDYFWNKKKKQLISPSNIIETSISCEIVGFCFYNYERIIFPYLYYTNESYEHSTS